MRVAVVHYHLRPGGVTRVIGRAAKAVRPYGIRTAVLSGGPASTGPEAGRAFRHVIVSGLGYADPKSARWPVPDVEACRSAARSALGGEPDLWHIHNHALGKNAALPGLVSALARQGEPMLLQIHDFSEDGRPENYRRLRVALGPSGMAALYPLGPRIRYALLTRRDRDFLLAAGAPKETCCRLPNPVEPFAVEPRNNRKEGLPLFLYPTRAIRRKNLGEFLLWSALLRGRARFATTLAPDNPEAQPVYERWTGLAHAWNLPVTFGQGQSGIPLGELLGQAHAAITTSVAEGFGLAFLEPWGAGLPLVGRNLPDITADFSDSGVRLDGLYPRLSIPGHWIETDALRKRIGIALHAAREAYGLSCSPHDEQGAFAAACGPDGVDIGRLDEPFQETVLRRWLESAEARAEWRPEPDLLSVALESSASVAHNAACVAESFSLSRYGERLSNLYRTTLDAPERGRLNALDPHAVLRAFSDPSRFVLLRS